MKILCKGNNQQLPASTIVNRVGKYLYNHIDGTYKYVKDRNTYDVYVDMEYQKFPEYTESPPIENLKIIISITTYRNKIRVNTIELTPDERTLGFDLFEPEELVDLEKAKYEILKQVKYRIRKAYPDYSLSI